MATARALIRHIKGHTLLAKAASNHWVPLDLPLNETPSAANDPFQLLLIACGGCVMIDVVDILTKSRQDFTLLEFEVEALRRDTPPKIIRKLEYRIQASGANLREEILRRAVELSLTKYCSVSLSLDRSVRFYAQLTVNGETGEQYEIPRIPELYED